MTTSKIYEILDRYAPKKLSDEYCERYGGYDNSGLLIDTGEEVEKILFSLDLTDAALEHALQEGVGLIVTHHPVIYGGKDSLSISNPMEKRLMTCIKEGISVVSMHLNLDTAEGGVDEQLATAVRRSCGTAKGEEKLMHPLSQGGYGRAYEIQPCTVEALAKGLQEQLGATRLLVYPAKERVSRVVSCCGAGTDEKTFDFAKEQDADGLISSDIKHHLVLEALSRGISVISPTHYATENYGFKKYFEKISKEVACPCVFHEDAYLL